MLSTTLLILKLLHQTALELSGDVQKGPADLVILILQFLIDFRYPMDLNFDAIMDITVRDALRSLVQLLKAFILQLFACIR